MFAALLPLLVATPTAVPAPLGAFTRPAVHATDEADDQYRFIAGLCEEGHFELAVKEAQVFLKKHPRHAKAPLARYRLATALFELDRPSEAAPHYDALSRSSAFEYKAESALRLGQCELLAERPEQARRALKRALASDQDYLHPSAAFFLAEAEFQLDDWKAAAQHYEQSLASEDAASYHDHALRGLAWSRHRAEDFKACAQAAARFLKRAPKHELSKEVLFLLGDACFELDRLEAAETAWKGIDDGEYAQAALRGRAYVRSRQGDDRGAATLFVRLLESDTKGELAREAAVQCGAHLLRAGAAKEALLVLGHPAAGNGPETLYWRARAQAETGANEEALATLERAAKSVGKSDGAELAARIATARGDVLFDLGRLEESAAAYGPDASDYALHAGATAQLNASNHTQALELCARFFREHGQSPYARSTRAVQAEALFQLGRHAESLEVFLALGQEQAQASDSERARLAGRAGWCSYYLGRFDQAAASFAEIVRAFPRTEAAAEARYMQGRCLFEAGHEKGAANAWRAYLQEHPGGAQAGEARLQLARLEGAGEHLEELLETSPDHALAPTALFELAEGHVSAGERGQAIERYRELLDRFPTDASVPRARYGLAWALREEGRVDEALPQLAALLGARPEAELELAALELTIWCAQDLENTQLALDAWRRLARSCEDDSRVTAAALSVAQTLRRGGQDELAEKLLREQRAQLKDSDLVLDLLVEEIWIGIDGKRPPAAEKRVREALAAAPSDPRVLEAAFFAGELHYASQAPDKAAPLYAAAARSENGELFDDALYKLGFALLGTGAHAEAAEAFERLVREQPASELWGESLFLAGECRFRAGDAKACAKHLAHLRQKLPKHDVRPKALFRLGLASRLAGDEKTAASALTELSSKHKDFPQRLEGLLEQGRALAALDRPRAARAAFDSVLEESSRPGQGSLFAARARIEIGRGLYQAGDYEEALSQFLKVSLLYAKGEEVREAQWLAGRCLEASGERELAIQQYRRLADDAPESRQGRAARERLRELDA